MSENQRAPGRGGPPGTPRWVKVFMIVFIALVLLVIVLHILGFGFGGHGTGYNTGMLSRGLVEYSLVLKVTAKQI